ncbi:protein phosphatase 2C domain-containing protein [soil metagenome]
MSNLPDSEMVQFELGILTRVGGRAANEDACAHWHSEARLACVVADGAGGHGGGAVASKLAVQCLIGRYVQGMTAAPAELEALFREASDEVRRHRSDAAEQGQMHTTAVALFVDLVKQLALWGHVGDSRLYVFRQGLLAQRTRDHSVVQALADAGAIAEGEMVTHAQRSELLCALGSEPEDLSVSVSDGAWRILPGDVFLLCSDGYWEHLDDAALTGSLSQAGDPQAWLQALELIVLDAVAEKPRHDNYSAISLWARPAAASN